MRKPGLQGSPSRPPRACLDVGWDKPETAGGRIGDDGPRGRTGLGRDRGRKTTADQPIFLPPRAGSDRSEIRRAEKGSSPSPSMVGRFSSEERPLRGIKGRSRDRLESFPFSFLSIRLHFSLRLLPHTNSLSYKHNFTSLHLHSDTYSYLCLTFVSTHNPFTSILQTSLSHYLVVV